MNFHFFRTVTDNKNILVPTLVGSALCLALPNLVSLIPIFDNYVYKPEFTFTVTALLQICLFACIYAEDVLDKTVIKKMCKNKIFIAEISALVLFLILCYLTPLGVLFGLSKNPVIYFLLSFVPPIALLVSYVVITFPKAKNGAIKEKKQSKM